MKTLSPFVILRRLGFSLAASRAVLIISSFLPTSVHASGQQEFWQISTSSRPISVQAADVKKRIEEPAMDHEVCVHSFQLKDLGVFNESVTVRRESPVYECETWTENFEATATLTLIKRTTEENGRGDGQLYCQVTITRPGKNEKPVFAAWYSRIKDSSACR